MIRVIVIAPTPMVQAGLQTLLSSTDIHVVGTSTRAEDSVYLSTTDVIVVVDDGQLEDTGLFLTNSYTPPLVVVTDNDEKTLIFLRKQGLESWGLVPSQVPAAQLRAAVIAVAQGLTVLPTRLARKWNIASPVETLNLSESDESLTPREREVLELVGQGLSNKLIARELHISEHTVKFHLSSLSAKLGAASRTEAVRLGMRRGLITL